MVKMTSYDENIKKIEKFRKIDFFFFCSDGPGEAAGPPESRNEGKYIFCMKKNMKTKVVQFFALISVDPSVKI